MAFASGVTFLPCTDIEQTHRFYHECLGLKLEMSTNGGLARVYDTGCGYWGFVQYGDGRAIPSGEKGVCLSLNCCDKGEVDRLFRLVSARGAEVAAPPQMHGTFPVYSAFFRDPDGYRVELQRVLL